LIVLGLDPGLGCTGWGMIRADGNRLAHVANGQIRTDAKAQLPARLIELHGRLLAVLAEHLPDAAAVEEVFVNDNPQSTLKLGQARGVVLLAAAQAGVEVGEYAPRLVKKALVGTGGADKTQVHAMVQRLLPGVKIAGVPGAGGASGVSVTTELFTAAAMARTVAVATPSALVVMDETYLVPALAPDSQAQPFAPGAVSGPLW